MTAPFFSVQCDAGDLTPRLNPYPFYGDRHLISLAPGVSVTGTRDELVAFVERFIDQVTAISDSPSPAASSDGPLSVSPDAPDRGDGTPHAVPAESPHGGGDAGGVQVVEGGLDTWTRAGADTGWWTGARL